MRTMGFLYPFRPQSWEELDEEFALMAATHPDFAHMSAVVKSVRHAKAEEDLAAFSSMHDLMVRATPWPEPPYDVVAVRAPNSMSKVPAGLVRIEHLAVTGRNDKIERPVAEAVPLFWRFMIEKFGIEPADGHPAS